MHAAKLRPEIFRFVDSARVTASVAVEYLMRLAAIVQLGGEYGMSGEYGMRCTIQSDPIARQLPRSWPARHENGGVGCGAAVPRHPRASLQAARGYHARRSIPGRDADPAQSQTADRSDRGQHARPASGPSTKTPTRSNTWQAARWLASRLASRRRTGAATGLPLDRNSPATWGGRYWDRTSGLFGVNEALSR